MSKRKDTRESRVIPLKEQYEKRSEQYQKGRDRSEPLQAQRIVIPDRKESDDSSDSNKGEK